MKEFDGKAFLKLSNTPLKFFDFVLYVPCILQPILPIFRRGSSVVTVSKIFLNYHHTSRLFRFYLIHRQVY